MSFVPVRPDINPPTRRRTPVRATKADYEVGYGRPPKKNQFKPGQSGNRKGRPRSARGVNTIARELLTKKVIVRTADGPKKMSKMEAMLHKLVEKAFAGDLRALAQLLQLYRTGVPDEVPAPEQAAEALLPPEQEAAALDALREILRDEIRAELLGDNK